MAESWERFQGSNHLTAELNQLAHKTVRDFATQVNLKDPVEVNLQDVINDVAFAKRKSRSRDEYQSFLSEVNIEITDKGLMSKAKLSDGSPYWSKYRPDPQIAGVTTGKQIDLVLAGRDSDSGWELDRKTLYIQTIAAHNYRDVHADILRNVGQEFVYTPVPDIEILRSPDAWLDQHKQKIATIKEAVHGQVIGKNNSCSAHDESAVTNVYKAPKEIYNFERVTFAAQNKCESIWDQLPKSNNIVELLKKLPAIVKYHDFDSFKYRDQTLVDNGYVPTKQFVFDGKVRKIENRDQAYCFLDASKENDPYSEFSIAKLAVCGEKATYSLKGGETGSAIFRFDDKVPLNTWAGKYTFPKPNDLIKFEAGREAKLAELRAKELKLKQDAEREAKLAEQQTKELELKQAAQRCEKLTVSGKINGLDQHGKLIPLRATALSMADWKKKSPLSKLPIAENP